MGVGVLGREDMANSQREIITFRGAFSQTGIGWLRLSFGVLHILMGLAAFFRPHMIELVKGYALLAQVASTVGWGYAMLVIGIGLLALPRASGVLILWQFLSASLFALFALLLTGGPTGFTWGSVVYGWLTLISGVMAYLTADQLFQTNGVPERLRHWLRFGHGNRS